VSAPVVAASPLTTRDLGPATERIVARDLVRRGLIVAPFAIGAGALLAGVDGALSVAFALGLVVANFWASAAMLAWATRISYALVMGVALFGFLLRLALVGAAVWAVSDQPWVAEVPLALALVAGHLGLLLWEARSVSASLAFPALKPPASKEPAA
jgi:hypothetical protein